MRIIRITLTMLCLLSLSVAAAPFKPSSDSTLQLQPVLPLSATMQQLSAQLGRHPEDNIRLELAGLYLQGARQPGYDDWFHRADELLHAVSQTGSVRYLLLQADLQQQQHQFSQAMQSLNKVFAATPHHQQASLMAARIYLAQNEQVLAQQACNRLWQQDLFLFSVCSYEVAGRSGRWAQSYAALQELWQRQRLTSELDIWLRGILAEQAEQLQQVSDARQWLTPILQNAPTSLWLKWADLSLQLNDAKPVYQRLSRVYQQHGLSDGLLLRLTLAERQLGAGRAYHALLTERIELRLARGDADHAADLVHYFLRLKHDAKAALYWATVNYQTAKEPDDLRLLTLSENAVKGVY